MPLCHRYYFLNWYTEKLDDFVRPGLYLENLSKANSIRIEVDNRRPDFYTALISCKGP